MKGIAVVERVLIGSIMAVLIVAALGKLLDPGGFRASLDSWAFIPRALHGPVSMGVPLLEIAIAAAWFIGLHRRTMAWLAAGLIALFSGLYGFHLAFSSPPNCHCLGLLVAFDRGQMFAQNLMVRNGIPLGMLGFAGMLALLRSGLDLARPRTLHATRVPGFAAPGFTLIETLLVIVLIGILIALTLPHLAGARDVAREISSLSMVRGHGQVMQIYSVDYAGYYPIFLEPDKPTTLRFAGRESIVRDYWLADILWRRALLDQYYDGNLAHASFFPPGATYGEAGGIAFRYTESYLAVPDFWDPATRTGRPQWRAVPAASTAYPAKKGLVTSWARVEPVPGKIATYYSPHDMTQDTAFVDGSAKTVKLADFLPWMRSGEGHYPGRQTTPFGWPVLHTMRGALGRDIQ